jgi:hypothetical protein
LDRKKKLRLLGFMGNNSGTLPLRVENISLLEKVGLQGFWTKM